jgi:mannonate dehydratase
MNDLSMKRSEFLSSAGIAALGLLGAKAVSAQTPAPSNTSAPLAPFKMYVGHQHDHSSGTLTLLSALGVKNICSGLPARRMGEEWSVDGLGRLRKHVESFGITLDAVPLPMSSSPVTQAEYPEIFLDKSTARDKAIDEICQMIRNAGKAGIPLLKYNFTYLGVVRTGKAYGRGGAQDPNFIYSRAKPHPAMTQAGDMSAEENWARIEYFLSRVIPVATECKVKLALHPNDPGLPQDRPYQGIYAVLSSVEGLKRFVNTSPSPYHGLNFCQGTICEMLKNPNQEIGDIIRYFGSLGKIFNVHFRNIKGGFLNFQECFPDEGDVDMVAALRVYREIGYSGMIMPDHVPSIESDTQRARAFSFCFGYIQALLQVIKQDV